MLVSGAALRYVTVALCCDETLAWGELNCLDRVVSRWLPDTSWKVTAEYTHTLTSLIPV